MKAALLLVAALLLLAPAADETRPFALAVLRRDGIAAPFAAFDGRRWRTPWPAEVTRRELPITLADVPSGWWGLEQRPERLALWRDGSRAGEVAITGLTMARPMCQPRIAVRSDYPVAPPVPPPFERPYPKAGLLVAGEAAIGPIEHVPKGSDRWNDALARITREFNEVETGAAGAFTNWRHPVRADDRRLVPITIEALYAAPVDASGWTAAFVEAVRRYPPGRDDRDGCGPLTYASGWILYGPGNRSRVRLSARITYCDRFGIRYMLPFGTVAAGGKTYWVFQFSGYESEWYEVMRPTPGGIETHVSYHAGTCSADRD